MPLDGSRCEAQVVGRRAAADIRHGERAAAGVRSVSFNRLPSLPIAAESFVGDAALIAVITSPSVLAVPRSMSTVEPSASECTDRFRCEAARRCRR